MIPVRPLSGHSVFLLLIELAVLVGVARLGAELMDVAGRSRSGLHGVHQHDAFAVGDLVEQRQPHLGGSLDFDLRFPGETLTHGLHDMQADGIVGQDVVAQTEDEDFGGVISHRQTLDGRHI